MKNVMDELKKIAEKKLGMKWEDIMKKADADTARLQKAGDPIAKAHKESSKSPKTMFKESMKKLNKK